MRKPAQGGPVEISVGTKILTGTPDETIQSMSFEKCVWRGHTIDAARAMLEQTMIGMLSAFALSDEFEQIAWQLSVDLDGTVEEATRLLLPVKEDVFRRVADG